VFTHAIDDIEVALKRPPRAEYKRFQKRVEKGDIADATEDLGRAAIVFPSKEEAEQLVEGRYPGLLEVVGGEAAKLARGGQSDAKKYEPS
jgi:hypothetical protein